MAGYCGLLKGGGGRGARMTLGERRIILGGQLCGHGRRWRYLRLLTTKACCWRNCSIAFGVAKGGAILVPAKRLGSKRHSRHWPCTNTDLDPPTCGTSSTLWTLDMQHAFVVPLRPFTCCLCSQAHMSREADHHVLTLQSGLRAPSATVSWLRNGIKLLLKPHRTLSHVGLYLHSQHLILANTSPRLFRSLHP
ncbi:hypothetical protein AUEXF2481DRAFT_229573 [Aureobasidium subglaciale EXF-2481]|uniref:Uncharacterized protein n=1 Tax=Aureobasidium subglaciale (strain EXF-2481) TaxID=1043005 RepID=A0A074YLH0_AURSE|nr:uncharacterized protein AUEXF2481DRAFT_229573 [Aureobasidium subglaciale EXF-2481]KEQ94967.1 hypothetical protein AUEXF2481DRAFT_229573 [Aureobasidium subglaciale EXF-2481]